jgi:hypothetical protein
MGMEISRVRYSRPDPFYLTANHEDRRLNCRRKAALNILRYIDIELRTVVLTSEHIPRFTGLIIHPGEREATSKFRVGRVSTGTYRIESFKSRRGV